MAKIKEESLRLNIIINGDKARKQIADTEKALEGFQKAQKRLLDLRQQLEATGRTESKQYQETEVAIKENAAAIEECTRKLDNMRKGMPLTSMTLQELRKHAGQTRAALSKAVPGTENFTKLSNELQATKKRMQELNRVTKATHKILGVQIQGWGDLWALIHSGISTVTRLYNTMTKATDAFQEYDEALTDAMKTTNLSKSEVSTLSEDLKKIDTRTAQNELLALLRIGGKLGVQGQENLLGFVRAADKINVALKEDLGGDAEAAIAQIGKMVDIFQLKDQFGLEDAMIKVGSAVNSLGMASTANEGYIVEFTRRLAGIAPNADISIDKILGLAATLDKYGQTAEMSSTAIGQTIMAMFKRTETFAGIAGMSLQDFTNLLNEDVNEAFIRVLEGMKGTDGSLHSVVAAMDQMNLDGQRAVQVLGTLSKNTDELRNQQNLANASFSEGASLIEEFNTKNTSATATLEKQKKAIHDHVVEIGQKLMPVVNGVMSLADIGTGLLSRLIGFTARYKAIIIALVAAKYADVAVTKIKNALTKENIRLFTQKVFGINAVRSATLLWVAAKKLLTGSLAASGKAFKLFIRTITTSLGPIGWLITAVGVIGGGLVSLVSKSRESTKALRELNKQTSDTASGYAEAATQIENERKALEDLKTAALEAAAGSDERAQAIQDINDKYGDYLPNLLTEKSSNEDIEEALRAVNDELERKILLQAKEQELVKVQQHRTDAVKAILTDAETLSNQKRGKGLSGAETKAITEAAVKYYDSMMAGDSKTYFEDALPALSSSLRSVGGTPKKIGKIREEFNEAIDSGKKLKNIVDELFKDEGLPNPIRKKVRIDPDPDPDPDPESTLATQEALEKEIAEMKAESVKSIEKIRDDALDAEEKRYEELQLKYKGNTEALEALENQHKLRMSRIHMDYLDGRIKATQEEYETKKMTMENDHAEALEIARQTGQDLQALQEKQAKELADLELEYANDLNEILADVLNQEGEIDISLTGLTPAELEKVKQKLQEIRALKFAITHSSSTSNEEPAEEASDDYPIRKSGTMFGLDSEEWFEMFDKGTDGWRRMELAATAFGNAAQDAMNIVAMAMDRQAKIEAKSLKQFEKDQDKKRTELERRLDAGLITEAQYNAEIEAMDAEYAAKEEEMALKQAKREKALSLTQAIINTAMGVTKALGSMVPPLNFINAGIVAAMGATEIALIASTPITTGYAKGGRMKVRREQDGRLFDARLSPDSRGFISTPTALVGEDGTEYVIPADGVRNPSLAPFLNTIESARQRGTLKDLSYESLYAPTMTGRASGGFISTSTTGSDPDSPDDDAAFIEILALIREIRDKMDDPTPAIVSMLGPNGFIKAFEKYEKMKKNGQA